MRSAAALVSFLLLGACVAGSDVVDGEGEEGDGEGEGENDPCVPAAQFVVRDGSDGSAFVPAGPPAGIERCGRSAWNRVAVVACTVALDDEARCGPLDTPEAGDCTADADCGSGVCLGQGVEGCRCFAVCGSDDDCGADQACLCSAGTFVDGSDTFVAAAGLPRCVAAGCRENADCGDAGACGVVFDECAGAVALLCRSDADGCRDDDDCGGTGTCFSDGAGPFACVETGTCN